MTGTLNTLQTKSSKLKYKTENSEDTSLNALLGDKDCTDENLVSYQI